MKNLKNPLLLTLIVFSSLIIGNITTAQPPPNLSLSEQMDYLITPLDFIEVSSGLLLDMGFLSYGGNCRFNTVDSQHKD